VSILQLNAAFQQDHAWTKLFPISPWSNYLWPTGRFTKAWQLAGLFQQMDVWSNRFTRFILKNRSECVIEITAQSNSLQVSIGRMTVVNASFTLSFLFQQLVGESGWKSETIVHCFASPSISVFRFDLLYRRKCTFSHTRMCFQTCRAFLVQNLSVWETYLCWLIFSFFTVHSPAGNVAHIY